MMNQQTENRSYFFVLAQKEQVFEKLFHWSRPDCYIIDLQDGCPGKYKETARQNIRKYASVFEKLNRKVIVRINEYSNQEEYLKDLEILKLDVVNGILMPYINSKEELLRVDEDLTAIERSFGKQLAIYPLIETVYSLEHVQELIQSSSKIEGVALGLYDLFADSDAKMTAQNISFVMNRVALAAKAAKLPFIDSPFVEVHNFAGLFRECERAVAQGAEGKIILHPDHIDVIHNYFSISSEEEAVLTKKLERYKEGCVMDVDGKFIGPPLIKKYKKQLSKKLKEQPRISSKSLKPIVYKYGLDLNRIYKNQVISSPYEITVDESWSGLWSSLVASSNYIEMSDAFAQKVGLQKKVVPYAVLINLALCLAVEPFSESCLLHLGLEDVVYQNPGYAGDTFSCYIHILDFRNTSDGKRSVVTSTHVLVNQHNQPILSFTRKTLFARIEDIERKLNPEDRLAHPLLELLSAPVKKHLAQQLDSSAMPKHLPYMHQLEEGDLIIHEANRMISESENLAFTTLFKNTHPVHFNYLKYNSEELIVCGGFVLSIVLANALKDFKQVLDQQIISCSHINKISPNDSISTVSYIHDRVIKEGYEELTIKTFGMRNVDAAATLANSSWPLSMFDKKDRRPAELEALLKEEMPELYHKLCVQVLWKIQRPINSAKTNYEYKNSNREETLANLELDENTVFI